MRRGVAKPRRAARLMTIANDEPFGARGLSPRAFSAKRRTHPERKRSFRSDVTIRGGGGV
jgi:hypothetical protein